ncbi:MAG: SAF domain-containing protein, partial [Pseudomonadota bacterium]
SIYIPYHLFHLETPISVARAVLFKDTVLAADGPIQVEVVAIAKRDLKVGERLDGIGGFMAYGECENIDAARAEDLLPIGLSEGCVLIRDVACDTVLRRSDVQMPSDRLCDRLRSEQDAYFSSA